MRLICYDCGKTLSGGIDTFGPFADAPMCETCWYDTQEKDEQPTYGYFLGGDPRCFVPDPECCTPEEIAAHQSDCAKWDESEASGATPTPEKSLCGWIETEKGMIHVSGSRYGIGVTYPTKEFATMAKGAEL